PLPDLGRGPFGRRGRLSRARWPRCCSASWSSPPLDSGVSNGQYDYAGCAVFSSSHTWLSSKFFAAAQNESAKSSFALNLRFDPSIYAQSSSIPNVRQPAAPVRLAASHARFMWYGSCSRTGGDSSCWGVSPLGVAASVSFGWQTT